MLISVRHRTRYGYDAPVTLAAALTVSDDGIHVDYTGTSAQSRYGINVPMAYTTAYTVFGLGCVVASKIPNNSGSLAPLTVSAPASATTVQQASMPMNAAREVGARAEMASVMAAKNSR